MYHITPFLFKMFDRNPIWPLSMEPVNAWNFLRNKDICKRTSPLCSSSNYSPKTCITWPPSHLKCSTGIQYGRLQNGGRQGHPTYWLPPRPNKVTYGCYSPIPNALRFTKGGKGLTPHSVFQFCGSIQYITHSVMCLTGRFENYGIWYFRLSQLWSWLVLVVM